MKQHLDEIWSDESKLESPSFARAIKTVTNYVAELRNILQQVATHFTKDTVLGELDAKDPDVPSSFSKQFKEEKRGEKRKVEQPQSNRPAKSEKQTPPSSSDKTTYDSSFYLESWGSKTKCRRCGKKHPDWEDPSKCRSTSDFVNTDPNKMWHESKMGRSLYQLGFYNAPPKIPRDNLLDQNLEPLKGKTLKHKSTPNVPAGGKSETTIFKSSLQVSTLELVPSFTDEPDDYVLNKSLVNVVVSQGNLKLDAKALIDTGSAIDGLSDKFVLANKIKYYHFSKFLRFKQAKNLIATLSKKLKICGALDGTQCSSLSNLALVNITHDTPTGRQINYSALFVVGPFTSDIIIGRTTTAQANLLPNYPNLFQSRDSAYDEAHPSLNLSDETLDFKQGNSTGLPGTAHQQGPRDSELGLKDFGGVMIAGCGRDDCSCPLLPTNVADSFKNVSVIDTMTNLPTRGDVEQFPLPNPSHLKGPPVAALHLEPLLATTGNTVQQPIRSNIETTPSAALSQSTSNFAKTPFAQEDIWEIPDYLLEAIPSEAIYKAMKGDNNPWFEPPRPPLSDLIGEDFSDKSS